MSMSLKPPPETVTVTIVGMPVEPPMVAKVQVIPQLQRGPTTVVEVVREPNTPRPQMHGLTSVRA
jgi:hypothetical protein